MEEAVRRHPLAAWAEVGEAQRPEALEEVEAVRRCLAWVEEVVPRCLAWVEEVVLRCLAWVEAEVLHCSALVVAAESISLALAAEEALRSKWEVVVVAPGRRSQGQTVQVATKRVVMEEAAVRCSSAVEEVAEALLKFLAATAEGLMACLVLEVVEEPVLGSAVEEVDQKAHDFQ